MRQWWGKLLFMHWPVPVSALRPLVPPQLSIDTFGGQAWVGVVPFRMWGVRASFAPPVPGLNAFNELNVRTYVHHRGVPGVWFHSLDIDSAVATWGARRFFYLPYHRAELSLRQQGARIDYSSSRIQKDAPPAAFRAGWAIGRGLPTAEPGPRPDSFKEAKARAVDEFERQYLSDLLLVHHGNITKAALAAKKNRRAFWQLLRKHHIDARDL